MSGKQSRRMILGAGAGALASGALATLTGPAAAFGASAASQPAGGPNVIPADRIGLQIFTVRTLIGADYKNLELALEAVHDAGVRELELAGTYYDKTTPELKRIVEAHGLRIVSNHFGPRTLTGANPWMTYEGRMQIFEEAQSLGRFPYVGTGSLIGFTGRNEATVDGYKRTAEEFNTAGEHAVSQGFGGFFFHNHDSEFALVNGRPLFHTLLENTNPRFVKFEVDLGWVSVAGEDPYWWVKNFGHRFVGFHIKDLVWDPNGNRTVAAGTRAAGRKYRFADVGKGVVDWTRTLSAIKDLRDYRFFLEHDDTGNPDLNPLGSPNTVWRGCSHLGSINTSGRK
ncbi:sugar phosphate isomerase/epimerase [Humibacillus xanthopallidus]|uniref:Sugar phosphate isomerase/epimerase n=1 Tax=Humibacillus xanthopallidus TaxID=412689 RepID=A0A543PWM9_9MICO|nr:sugar phosphate isomerase/epimerase [Humibacillus xanthopallidus]TQN48479.1 sugar phosphate isomerase/epimerase [Humibacillus xanthopallidus]